MKAKPKKKKNVEIFVRDSGFVCGYNERFAFMYIPLTLVAANPKKLTMLYSWKHFVCPNASLEVRKNNYKPDRNSTAFKKI